MKGYRPVATVEFDEEGESENQVQKEEEAIENHTRKQEDHSENQNPKKRGDLSFALFRGERIRLLDQVRHEERDVDEYLTLRAHQTAHAQL
jgi:hypothetical protein